MKVENVEMFHFHNNKTNNDMWVPNSEIIVDDSFETAYLNILRFYSTAVNTTDGKMKSFDSIIDGYLKEKQDEETYIRMLREASRIIYGMNIFKREMALEEVRKLKFPDLPSRKHSIWLCKENGLDFWEDQLSHKGRIPLDLYKVLITGDIFKSSDSFIPDNYENYETNLKQAENYWNPNFTTEEQEIKAEYLFQGKLKVLEKVNR